MKMHDDLVTLKPSSMYLMVFFQTSTIRVVLGDVLTVPSCIIVGGASDLKPKNIHPSYTEVIHGVNKRGQLM